MRRDSIKKGNSEPKRKRIRIIELLVRGGVTLTNASQIVGVPFGEARYKLEKLGGKVLSIRPFANRMSLTPKQVWEATELILQGASPEDMFLMTNITMTQLSFGIDDICRDAQPG